MSEGLGLDSGDLDVILLHDGTTMQTHGPARCLGPNCCIHNPSEHPLRTAPLAWVPEMKMMFRVCEHDSMHPDPDALAFNTQMALMGLRANFYDGWHPCCTQTCCQVGDGIAGAETSELLGTENTAVQVEEDEVVESFECPECEFVNYYSVADFNGFCRRCHTYSGPPPWRTAADDSCHSCAQPNPIWWVSPQIWDDVMGIGGLETVLCPTCFLLRAQEVSEVSRGAWQIYPPGELSSEPKPPPRQRRRR